MLTRHRTVMHRDLSAELRQEVADQTKTNLRVKFTNFDFYGPPTETLRHSDLDLDYNMWEEMGKPETITVAVAPGNTLEDDVTND